MEERRALESSEADDANDIALALRRPKCGSLIRLPHRIRDEGSRESLIWAVRPTSVRRGTRLTIGPPRITRRSVRPRRQRRESQIEPWLTSRRRSPIACNRLKGSKEEPMTSQRKKTAPPTRKHSRSSSSGRKGLIAKGKTKKQSVRERTALDNRFHRTSEALSGIRRLRCRCRERIASGRRNRGEGWRSGIRMEPSWTEPPPYAWGFIRGGERAVCRRQSGVSALSGQE